MILQEELQYIGRSSPVGCDAGYEYYVLVYAGAVAVPEAGGHRVRIQTRLACNRDASFYGFTTSGFAALGEQTLYSWQRRQIPEDYWGDSPAITEGGARYPRWTYLSDGEVMTAGTLAGGELLLSGYWVMESSLDKGWFPYTGEKAEFSLPVTLLPAPGQTEVTLSPSTVALNGTEALQVTLHCNIPAATYRLEAFFGAQPLLGPISCRGSCALALDPEIWLPKIPNRPDTLGLPREEAPALEISTVDAQGNVLRQQRLRFDIAADKSCGPEILGVTLEPVSLLAPPYDKFYLQNLSRVKATVSALGRFGAEVTGSKLTVEGVTYEENPVSGMLVGYGTIPVRITVTDSRGLSSCLDTEIYAEPYLRPVLSLMEWGRCDLDGHLTDTGTRLFLRASGSCAASERMENRCCLELRWKGQSDFTDWLPLTETTGMTAAFAGSPETETLDTGCAYCFQLRCRDTVGGWTVTEFTLAQEQIYMHRTPRGMGLGKYVEEENLLDCGWDLWVRGQLRLGDQGQTLEEYIRSIIAGG